jgi:ACT domain-containing protein
MKRYVIIELVRTTKGAHTETVVEFEIYRPAYMRYKELIEKHPTVYFELLEIEHKETCLEFTKERFE